MFFDFNSRLILIPLVAGCALTSQLLFAQLNEKTFYALGFDEKAFKAFYALSMDEKALQTFYSMSMDEKMALGFDEKALKVFYGLSMDEKMALGFDEKAFYGLSMDEKMALGFDEKAFYALSMDEKMAVGFDVKADVAAAEVALVDSVDAGVMDVVLKADKGDDQMGVKDIFPELLYPIDPILYIDPVLDDGGGGVKGGGVSAPEPSTWALLVGMGFCSYISLKRRKQPNCV